MDLGLKGKVAMVAAASQGLGYAIARALAAEGVKVSIAARKQETVSAAAAKIAAETGGEVIFSVADVASVAAIEGWHKRHTGRTGEGSISW